MTREMTVKDVDAFIRQFKLLISGIVVLLVVPLNIYAYYLDRRLDAFEDTLQHTSRHRS